MLHGSRAIVQDCCVRSESQLALGFDEKYVFRNTFISLSFSPPSAPSAKRCLWACLDTGPIGYAYPFCLGDANAGWLWRRQRCVMYRRRVLRSDGSSTPTDRTVGRIPLLLTTSSLLALLALLLVVRVLARDEQGRPACPGTPEACAGPVPPVLPDAIRFGASMPTVTVALFVDLGSTASRQVFQRVTRAIARASTGRAMQLRLFHAPGNVPGDGTSAASGQAARTVECVERQIPGAGIRAAGLAFDMQWQPRVELLASMVRLGVDAGALGRCVEADREVDARLAAHADAARRYGLTAAPGGFVIVAGDSPQVAPFGAWLTEASLRILAGCILLPPCQGEL